MVFVSSVGGYEGSAEMFPDPASGIWCSPAAPVSHEAGDPLTDGGGTRELAELLMEDVLMTVLKAC